MARPQNVVIHSAMTNPKNVKISSDASKCGLGAAILQQHAWRMVASSVCIYSDDKYWNEICANWEGTSHHYVCMRTVPSGHIRTHRDCWNWPYTTCEYVPPSTSHWIIAHWEYRYLWSDSRNTHWKYLTYQWILCTLPMHYPGDISQRKMMYKFISTRMASNEGYIDEFWNCRE